jgi:hypothetical protein
MSGNRLNATVSRGKLFGHTSLKKLNMENAHKSYV